MKSFPELVVDAAVVPHGRRGVPAVVAMHRLAAEGHGGDGLRRLGAPRRAAAVSSRPAGASATTHVRDCVLVAADPSQELLGLGVLRVLEDPSNPWEAHGVATTADDVVSRIVTLKPRVLVATTQVGEAFPPYLVEAAEDRVRVILLAEDLNGRYEATLLRSGAQGVLALSASPALLLHATQTVLDGFTWMSQEATSLVVDEPRVRPLTPERRAVLVHLARHLSIGQVACEMQISESGVKSHVARIGRATGIMGVRALRLNADRLLAEDDIARFGLEPVVELKPSPRLHGVGREGSPG
jgi:DNA-binding NarL/FixJ family response regulator